MPRLLFLGALLCATGLAKGQSVIYSCLTDDAPINDGMTGLPATVTFDATNSQIEVDTPHLNLKGTADVLLDKSAGKTTYYIREMAFSPQDNQADLFLNNHYLCNKK